MKIKQVILFIILFGIVGYIREFFFVHLNIIMYEKYYKNYTSPLPIPHLFDIFDSFSYQTLYYSKYVFTIIWILLFYALSFFTVKKLNGEKNLLKYLRVSYFILLLLASVIMAFGVIINKRLQDDEYSLSRWLLGIAQSPIICFILLASNKLYKKSLQS